MPKLSIMLTMIYSLLMILISQPSSARTLGVPSSNHHHHHHHQVQQHHHHAHSSHSTPTMSFLIRDVLNNGMHSSRPTTGVVSNQLPFSKPAVFLPPSGGIPLTQPNPTRPSPITDQYSTQTFDLSSISLSFPARATLQELDFGNVIVVDEDIFEERSSDGSSGLEVFGKAQGIYVSSSEGGHSHMMAITVVFSNDEFKDSLRFFGVKKMIDDSDSHIAIIGGIGKYSNANGYATIKGVNYQNGKAVTKLLLFKVYLSVEA